MPITLMHIDDEPDIREVAAMALEERGKDPF